MGMTEKAGAWSSHSRHLYLGLQAQEGLSAPDGSQKELVLPSAWGPWREGGIPAPGLEERSPTTILSGGLLGSLWIQSSGEPLCDPLARLR